MFNEFEGITYIKDGKVHINKYEVSSRLVVLVVGIVVGGIILGNYNKRKGNI